MGKHSKNGGGKWLGSPKSGPARKEAREAHERIADSSARARSAPAGAQIRSSGAQGDRARREALDSQLSPQIKKQRRRRTLTRVLVGIAAAIALLALAGVAYGWYFVNNVDNNTTKSAEVIEAKKVLAKAEPQKPFTILLLGADYRPGDTAWRTDTIILAKVDPEKKQVWLVSIPRDTKVDIPGHGTQKINAAHAFGGAHGGPALMIETVEKFTGVPINHYAEVNFKGFRRAVDALGGVWVDVDQPINDWKAASANEDHAGQKISKGYQKLDGAHALVFVRSRNFPDADFTRMKHQQQFFAALAEQLKKSPIKAPAVVEAVSQHMKTDLSVIEMLRIATAMKGVGKSGVYTATMSGEWISPYVYTDKEKKRELIAALKGGYPFDKKPKASAETSSSIPPGDISVEIRNGSGTSGQGGAAGKILAAAGYDVGEIKNAKKSDYTRTLVVYNGADDKAAAENVAAALPGARITDGKGQYVFTSRILVVVGKDWDRVASAAGKSGASTQ